MKAPKISIIMPVYNAEKTVSRMIDSISAQTFPDWELICVDDGSKDSSGMILDDYAVKDSRIRVIHKANAGVSAARQDGLDVAQGEYVIHADSDDWVDTTMLEELCRKAKEEDADIVICDFYSNTSNKQIYVKQQPYSLEPKIVLRELFQQLHGSCCNKLARRVCYSKYNIKFPKNINHSEDLLTWFEFLQHEEVKVSYLPKAFYHYNLNSSSITHAYTRKTFDMRIRFFNKVCEVLLNKGFDDELHKLKLGILTEAFSFGAISCREFKQECDQQSKQIAFNYKSLRWRLGYHLLWLEVEPIARKLLKY